MGASLAPWWVWCEGDVDGHAACRVGRVTGGRCPFRAEDLHHPFYPHVPVAPAPEQRKAEELFAIWVDAMAFRRAVNRKLKKHGATFTQWRFLLAAELLVEEVGDAVSQQDIGRRAGIDEKTASVLTWRLGRRDWLSVGLDGEGYAYRLSVTETGQAFLAETRGLILDAGLETWGRRLRAAG